jgi:hypothetical protein
LQPLFPGKPSEALPGKKEKEAEKETGEKNSPQDDEDGGENDPLPEQAGQAEQDRRQVNVQKPPPRRRPRPFPDIRLINSRFLAYYRGK